MKNNYNLIVTLCLLVSNVIWSQTTLVQWNFNGVDAASVLGGAANPTPAIGTGTLVVVGGATTDATTPFASGVGSTDLLDTTPQTNFGLVTTNYPALGVGNKTAGAQINVSTVGYADITFRFDQRLSNTSNNTYVIQYTADRTAGSPIWVDAQLFTFTPAATGTGDVWYNLRSVDLSAVTALDNNANVAFRVVSAFDPTTGNYLASKSTSTYAITGKVRLDMVTVSAATTLSTTEFELNQNKFSVYPNPVKENIIYFNEFSTVSIYDITGKSVLKGVDVKELNVSSLSSGVYFVKNSDGNTIKLIKE
jgi:hypothetical protein